MNNTKFNVDNKFVETNLRGYIRTRNVLGYDQPEYIKFASFRPDLFAEALAQKSQHTRHVYTRVIAYPSKLTHWHVYHRQG